MQGARLTGQLIHVEVQAAEEKLTTAKEALRAAHADPLPELSIQAGIDETGWKISWGVSIDLFEPDRFLQIDSAAANLELAEAQLEAAQERVKNNILNRQALLKKALDDLERLPLEEEKWTLEETVKREKLEAGLLSTEEWNDFQEEKNRFHLTANEREASLLLAYFRYCDSLGLDLNWEEWTQ